MTASDWEIRSDGVGRVRIGEALPKDVLGADLEARYLARYVADAQPFEGFALESPPLTVLIEGGPFARKVEQEGPVEPVADPYRAAGAKAAREGAKVRAVLVRGAGPATAAGVGVGSKLAALKAAYADLKVHPVPPTLGGDECVAESAGLPNVRFLFATCAAAEADGAVLRVDLWPAQ